MTIRHIMTAIQALQRQGTPATAAAVGAVVAALLPQAPGGAVAQILYAGGGIEPLLERLEERGLLRSEHGPDGREWRLTEFTAACYGPPDRRW